jgi:hypothetical protein
VIATVSTPAKLVNNPCFESIRTVAAEAMPHHAIADNITAGEIMGCILIGISIQPNMKGKYFSIAGTPAIRENIVEFRGCSGACP